VRIMEREEREEGARERGGVQSPVPILRGIRCHCPVPALERRYRITADLVSDKTHTIGSGNYASI